MHERRAPRRYSFPRQPCRRCESVAARSTVWGDGNAGTFTLAYAYVLTAISVTRNYPVYGRLFPSQNVSVGSYADSIAVTLNF